LRELLQAWIASDGGDGRNFHGVTDAGSGSRDGRRFQACLKVFHLATF
jgi:hypothetical protein